MSGQTGSTYLFSQTPEKFEYPGRLSLNQYFYVQSIPRIKKMFSVLLAYEVGILTTRTT
jgi:hypothetical protein